MNAFPADAERLRQARLIHDRDDQLVHCVKSAPSTGLLLEFGVFKGKSINVIASAAPPRRVWGFDTFTGLPEFWRPGRPAGHFSLNGRLPDVRDNVSLVAGRFDMTLPGFLKEHPQPIAFVNIDSDLYSSCFFVLSQIESRLAKGAIVYFDEIVDWNHSGKYPDWPKGEYKAYLEWKARAPYEIVPHSRNGNMGASVMIR